LYDELDFALRNSDSSPGIDGITNNMIYHLGENFKHKLLDIFNSFLSINDVPENLKDSLVCPILKPNKDPQLAGSYRPIVFESCILKVLERMEDLRLKWFLEHKGLLKQTQFGFRSGMGVTEAVTLLTTMLGNDLSCHLNIIVVFLDIEKAYDHVNHLILSNK